MRQSTKDNVLIGVLVTSCLALGALVLLLIHDRHDYVLEVPTEYATIETAVAAAQDGDRVQISRGVYTANLLWVGKDLTIAGSGPDSTTVTFPSFFAGTRKDEAGRLTKPVRVVLADMTIMGSTLLLTDTTAVHNALITGSRVMVTGVTEFENVLLHHNDVDVNGGRREDSQSEVTMTNVTLWDNDRFFFEGRNVLTAKASILQEWRAMVSGITNDRDRSEFNVTGSYTANPLYTGVSDNWVPRFRNAASGDYTLCASPITGPIGAQF